MIYKSCWYITGGIFLLEYYVNYFCRLLKLGSYFSSYLFIVYSKHYHLVQPIGYANRVKSAIQIQDSYFQAMPSNEL